MEPGETEAIRPVPGKKSSLDKDLQKFTRLEEAGRSGARQLASAGFALSFLAMAGVLASLAAGDTGNNLLLVIAAVFGSYMALNIGANDVANNVGPAVGARALTMTGALVIAAVFEGAGAIIAGADVVRTISSGIVDPASFSETRIFIWAMMAALLASAMWINLATWIGAPVSTTHAVVGGVLGAGIAAAGFQAVNWSSMGAIAASWVISPLFGGVIAAIFLAFIKHFIIYTDDKIASARRWVPVLIAIMAGAFAAYLAMKGLKNIVRLSAGQIGFVAAVVFVLTWLIFHPMVRRQSEGLENRNQSLRRLFHIPLIFSAALLSFAHGANDVANAIGPLAAILSAISSGSVEGRAVVPFWVMMIGAAGIGLGLFLYGPRLIRTVGEQITRMNPMRAYCVALSAAITVIVASWFGLPVSSTHIAVGAVFGVGFFREYYTARSRRRRLYVRTRGSAPLDFDEVSSFEEMQRRKLVRRSHFTVIVAAWLITVPAAAGLAAAVFLVLRTIG